MNTKDFVSNENKSEAMMRALEKHIPEAIIPAETEAQSSAKEMQDDYEFSRKSYRELVTKSNGAIEAMLELAMQSEHPRAFEVLSTMLKNTSEITDKLMDLQRKKRDMKDPAAAPAQSATLTQNNTFIGTTKEFQRQLIDQLAKKNVTDTAPALQ